MIQRDCFAEVREDLDQQLMRVLNCGGGGNVLVPIKYDTKDPTLYELPKTTYPVNAPLDSTNTEPGVRPTVQPAPGQVPVVTKTEEPAATTKSGVMKWVEDNPLVAGGGLLLLLFALSKRKKR